MYIYYDDEEEAYEHTNHNIINCTAQPRASLLRRMEDADSAASRHPSEFNTFSKFTPAETTEIQYRNPTERAADGLTIGGSISRPNYVRIEYSRMLVHTF
jgi:hypothetical protein